MSPSSNHDLYFWGADLYKTEHYCVLINMESELHLFLCFLLFSRITSKLRVELCSLQPSYSAANKYGDERMNSVGAGSN